MLRFARSANISRRFSVLRTPRQSSASVLQQYEQQNKFDEIEREVESLLEKTEKENVEEALKVLSRIEKQHKLKHPLFMVFLNTIFNTTTVILARRSNHATKW
jgi:hypothetical protein